MSDTRARILDVIRRGRGRRGPLDEDAVRALEARLATHRRNLVPARTDIDAAARVALFVSMAEEAAATVTRVRDAKAVPKALADYLASANLPTRLVMAPDAELAELPWDKAPMLDIHRGVAEAGDMVSLTPSFAGIAETGTLMLVSGPAHPSTLNLLPDTHVVLLRRSRIVGSYEDGWDRLRAARADAATPMPRTVLFVTGPSRSADIEQTLQLGAHGPRRLHILLLNDDDASTP